MKGNAVGVLLLLLAPPFFSLLSSFYSPTLQWSSTRSYLLVSPKESTVHAKEPSQFTHAQERRAASLSPLLSTLFPLTAFFFYLVMGLEFDFASSPPLTKMCFALPKEKSFTP